ncbi:hypothetical protein JIN85_08500 [Luteolibacter pohnpeiensis]|uniref:Calcium-dependent phosphoinositide phospholipase C n=1 Tax=Luteolibacter pohnpeiensis TaxID=454153 RepID=A0A934S555_9BACT|nr:Ca2+-dependent phosphoinositide-specific phospholipase C [Luteolibacter pohnpeiensis]MBK1882452.1 hypothetical protein [Luteolibacter pohnpeiensis]
MSGDRWNMSFVLGAITLLSGVFVLSGQSNEGDAEMKSLRLNQVQVIGSHNSYHIPPGPTEVELMKRKHHGVAGLNYGGTSLSEQLNDGVRQIELDLYPDWEGGRFAKPAAFTEAEKLGLERPQAYDPDGRMLKPGIKVLHEPDLDFRSTTLTLQIALEEVNQWSKSHPQHYPIFILLELKGPSKDWQGNGLKKLESEILSVISKNRILTPDDVRGAHSTLREAIMTDGWPLLQDSVGRLMFGLDNENELRDGYLSDSPNLHGRLLFPSCADEKNPAAAWFKINDAKHDFERIQHLVKHGFLVRTRADVGLKKDPVLRDQAMDSGAQFISTDFPGSHPNDYGVIFADHAMMRRDPMANH